MANGKRQKKELNHEKDAAEGGRLKLGDTHPNTIESWNNLIDLYEAWNKPEQANQWRTKLTQIEDFEE